MDTSTPTDTLVVCPLCSSRCTPHTKFDYSSSKTLPVPHQFICSSSSCRFVTDSRLPDCVGMKLNGNGTVTVTSDYALISSDSAIALLTYTELRDRLRVEEPHPSLRSYTYPDNPTPSFGRFRYGTHGDKPRNTSSFILHRLPLPLYTGSSLDELRVLSRKLGPIQVPSSLSSIIPNDDSADLFILASTPHGAEYECVTCNPRAAKAKTTLRKNKGARALAAVDKYPLPDPSFFASCFTLIPLPPAHDHAAYSLSISSRCSSRDPLDKTYVDSVKSDRGYAARAFFFYLGSLLSNTRHPPHRVCPSYPDSTYSAPSAHGWSPSPTRTNRLRCGDPENYFSNRSALAHSPCTRWWHRNPTLASNLLSILSPYDLSLYHLHSLWWNSLTRTQKLDNPSSGPGAHPDHKLAELDTPSPHASFWIFSRLRHFTRTPTPIFTPPVLEVPVPVNPSSVEGRPLQESP